MSDNTSETIDEEPKSFIQQFEALSKQSLLSLETVVKQGLLPVENEVLLSLAAELIQLATIHDPEALAKVTAIIHPAAQDDHSQSF